MIRLLYLAKPENIKIAEQLLAGSVTKSPKRLKFF